MGLANVIQKATVSAFKAIGDIPLTCIYTSKGTSVYAPATGLYTALDLEYIGLSILFENYSVKEVTDSGGVILATDIKMSIPQLNLVPDPVIKDIIIDSDSKNWTIEDISQDSARALWIFQGRQS